MFRLIILIIIMMFFMPTVIFVDNTKATFIRDGNLWTLLGNQESQVTKGKNTASNPKWSNDGKWILYQVTPKHQTEYNQIEIWAYNIETKRKKKVAGNGDSPSWAPNKNLIAYKDHNILDISDLQHFYNIAAGVSGFTWLPDGSGFLLSSSAHVKPNGWTNVDLYKKKLNNYKEAELFDSVNHFFTIPKEIGTEKEKILAILASDFSFSPSNNWISFIVSPTASWSMDSNMLCVITSDGKKFEVLDEVIFGVGKPKWAPSTDTIAYIAGGGRIVLGFKNKDLKVREMPATGSFTPVNYVDLDFDWLTNESIVTSRMKESEWSDDFSKQPRPSLYSIDIQNNQQDKISNPPKGYGDYNPQYIKSIDKIVWFRGISIIDADRTLWKANPDGTGAEAWIKNVDTVEIY